MATKKSQRIFIWVIAIVMTVGTVAGFIAMMIAPTNQKIDQAAQEKAIAEYQKQAEKQEAERLESLRPLDGYQAEAFDAAAVTSLQTDVLVEGSGEALQKDSPLNINYFGWTADGKIFDSTNINGVTTPNDQLTMTTVIEGWKKGLVGKKIGSTVKLMVPTELAYGENAAASGRPEGPLAFIVEIK